MVEITLLLDCYDKYPSSPSTLLCREVGSGAVPHVGDEVALWYDGDGEDGPLWGVKRSWMRPDGSWVVALTSLIKDPNEAARVMIAGDLARGGPQSYRGWHSAVDKQPIRLLTNKGWREWNGS